jgi:hypothetical protein
MNPQPNDTCFCGVALIKSEWIPIDHKWKVFQQMKFYCDLIAAIYVINFIIEQIKLYVMFIEVYLIA